MMSGLILILVAFRLRTPAHPVWYRAGLASPFGGKKVWWRGPGYLLPRVDSALFAIGIISGVIYFGRFLFSGG